MGNNDDAVPEPHEPHHGHEGDVRPPARRDMEARKLRALLEVIEFSGVDLLDIDDKTEFTDRLAQAKRSYERRRRRAEGRPKVVLAIFGAIASAIFTLNLPDAMAWVKAHWP